MWRGAPAARRAAAPHKPRTAAAAARMQNPSEEFPSFLPSAVCAMLQVENKAKKIPDWPVWGNNMAGTGAYEIKTTGI